jgi:hypothetical protein
MPEKTPFHCTEFSLQQKVTSDSWWLSHIKLHHPKHLQVVRQKNLTVCSTPRRIEPTPCGEFNAIKDSGEELDPFPNLEYVENIATSDSQPQAPPLLRTEIYRAAATALMDYIPEQCARNVQGFLETNLHNNPFYPFGTREEYK